MQLRDVLNEPRLRAVVGRIAHLPGAAPHLHESARRHGEPDVSVREVARIISEDPAVAAKVLQMVNSAFFRLARRITQHRAGSQLSRLQRDPHARDVRGGVLRVAQRSRPSAS